MGLNEESCVTNNEEASMHAPASSSSQRAPASDKERDLSSFLPSLLCAQVGELTHQLSATFYWTLMIGVLPKVHRDARYNLK